MRVFRKENTHFSYTVMIKQQGSNRVYTRETDENGRSVIRVVGTNRDENRAFIYMARHFHALGLPVPEVYWVSDDEMSYTQEDLGDTLLFDNLDPTLLERTIRALAHVLDPLQSQDAGLPHTGQL